MEIGFSDLPTNWQELIDLIGFDWALKLTSQCGGARITIAKDINKGNIISLILPESLYERFHERFSDGLYDVPVVDGMIRALRHQHVIELWKAGNSTNDIAIQAGYSTMSVYRIISAYRKSLFHDERQLSLF